MTEAAEQIGLDKSRYFVQGAFRRFFVPALLSSFWLAVAGVADSVFVGNGIGAEGLAAISLGQPVYLFYNILSYGFSIGGSIHFAQKLAEGKPEEGNRIFHTVLRLLLCIYLVTVALGLAFQPMLMRLLGADPSDAVTRTYIRTQLLFVPVMFCQGPFYYFVNADNGPKTAAFAMSLSGITDALFSYIFVIRMHLGVAGSVYSTVIGALLMLVITGRHIVAGRGTLNFRWQKMDWREGIRSGRTGMATSLQYLFQFITVIAVNRVLMGMGGQVAVAAFNVVYNISLLCSSFSEGTVVATEPMLASYRGERNTINIRITLHTALFWAGVLSAVFACLLGCASDQFSILFGMKEGMELLYASQGIRIFAISVLPAMVNVIFSGYYQSIRKEEVAFLITFLRSFLFYLLALYLCSRGGMETFWYVFVAAEMMALAVWMPIAFLSGGILQIREMDTARVRTVVIDSTAQDIVNVSRRMQDFCEENGASPQQVMYAGLVIEEICMAVTERFRARMGEIYIQVTAVAENGETVLYLRDNALEFNPLAEDTDGIDFGEGRNLDLMGIRIVQKKAKEFYYRHYSGFNTLVIRL